MIKKINVEDVAIGTRKRRLSSKIVDNLVKSIQKVGLLHPIIIDSDNNLISGQHRLLAAKKLNYDQIEVRVANIKSNEYGDLKIELSDNCDRTKLDPFDQEALLDALKKERDKIINYNTTQKDTDDLDQANALAREAGFSSNAQAKRLTTVSNRGTEELKQAVRDQAVTISGAVKISRLSQEEQIEAVNNIKSGIKVINTEDPKSAREEKKKLFNKDNHGSYTEVKIYRNNIEKSAKNISSLFGESFRENYIALISELFIESRKYELKLNQNLYKTYSYGFTNVSDGEVIEIKELLDQGMKKVDIVPLYGCNREIVTRIDKMDIVKAN